MKTGLVLSGGGAKGAYEAGAYKALLELGYHFDIVTGTSIGALNGLLITQHDEAKMYHMWENLSVEQVLAEPIVIKGGIAEMLDQRNLLKSFFKSYLNEKGADITPLKQLCLGLYDGEAAQQSNIDYGIVTVKYPSLKPLEITKKEMNKDDMLDYAFASASCFPAFPVYHIGDEGYIDGGYFDNVPIALAIEMGADEIIAIELNQQVTHSYYQDRPNITIITPSRSLGDFLDFDNASCNYRMRTGYNDIMKKYGKYHGFLYTFNPPLVNVKKQKVIYKHILRVENNYNRKYLKKMFKTNAAIPISNYLKHRNLSTHLNLADYYYLSLETLMTLLDYPIDAIYDPRVVVKEIVNEFKTYLVDYQSNDDKHLLSLQRLKDNLSERSNREAIIDYLKELHFNQAFDLTGISEAQLPAYIGALFIESELSNEHTGRK